MIGRRTFGLAMACAMLPSLALAQDYPSKGVAVVVPFSAGGSNDTIARYMAQVLSANLGQPFVVENRPGGGTAVGAAHVAVSEPDGHTILFVSSSYTMNAASRADLPFDAVEDLKAVSIVAVGDLAVISGPNTNIKTLQDLQREASSREVFYATAGIGSQQHFLGEMLAKAMGIKMTAVPYPGGAEGLTDLLGGRIDILAGGYSGMIATIEAGANPLAALGLVRIPSEPDMPTAAEAGFPDAMATNYWTVMVPAATPPEVVAKLNTAIQAAFASPAGTEFLASIKARPADPMTPEDSHALVARDLGVWKEVAGNMGMKN